MPKTAHTYRGVLTCASMHLRYAADYACIYVMGCADMLSLIYLSRPCGFPSQSAASSHAIARVLELVPRVCLHCLLHGHEVRLEHFQFALQAVMVGPTTRILIEARAIDALLQCRRDHTHATFSSSSPLFVLLCVVLLIHRFTTPEEHSALAAYDNECITLSTTTN